MTPDRPDLRDVAVEGAAKHPGRVVGAVPAPPVVPPDSGTFDDVVARRSDHALFQHQGEALVGLPGLGAPPAVTDGLPRPSGVAFPYGVVAAPPGPGNRYASFPGQALTARGDVVVVYRLASTHSISNDGDDSVLVTQRSRDLKVWSPAVQVYNTPAGYDARDPNIYREPGTRDLYMTWCDIPAVGTTGLTTKVWVSRSTDDGFTWGTPVLIPGASNTGMPLRRNSDGVWRLPFFKLTTLNESWVAETGDPIAGPWTTRKVMGNATKHRNEWDYTEVSSTLWVAAFRNSGGSQLAVSVSTDHGATWADSVEIQTISAMLYDGWPCPVTFSDGSVGIFVRGTNGLRLVQCLDPADAMNPAAWAEPAGAPNAVWRPLDYIVGTNGIPVGKFQPFRVGDVWYGAYYIELDLVRDKTEVRFGVFNERDLRAKQVYRATQEKIPDASPANALGPLPTPDTIVIRTNGGKFRVAWSTKSNQLTGTISSYVVDVLHTGKRWVAGVLTDEVAANLGAPIRRTPESATRLANSGVNGAAQPGWNYFDEADGIVELGPGVHTFTLAVSQANTAVGRSFSERKLSVTPL